MTFEADERGAKKRDYWFTVLLTDPVAVRIARALARTGKVTPNQVTVTALVTGLAVGVLFATGQRWGLIAGAGAFYLAFVLDCVDGKLARATGTSSPKGEALDALADAGRRASGLLGLAWAAWRPTADVVAGHPLGPEDAVDHSLWAVLLYGVLAYLFLEISGAPRSGEGGGRWTAALARRRLLPTPGMPDVQAVVFIAGPATGFVAAGLYVGMAMVSVAILLTVVRRTRA